MQSLHKTRDSLLTSAPSGSHHLFKPPVATPRATQALQELPKPLSVPLLTPASHHSHTAASPASASVPAVG